MCIESFLIYGKLARITGTNSEKIFLRVSKASMKPISIFVQKLCFTSKWSFSLITVNCYDLPKIILFFPLLNPLLLLLSATVDLLNAPSLLSSTIF